MSLPTSVSAHPFDVAIFEDRLILHARAPITDDERNEIESRCAGPIPPGLDQLWRISFGGQIDYGLSVEFDQVVHEFGFTQLFYPGSDHYHDLFGWMDHEAEGGAAAAERAGSDWQGKLAYLPFGGFEYLERLYVCVETGPDYGAVFAYAQGLPSAWILHLNDNAIARIADNVPALFRALDLPSNPAAQDDEFGPGSELIAKIDEIGEIDPSLAASLNTLVQSAVIDWQSAIGDGTLASKPRHRRLALRHASSVGDIGLLDRLRAAGCDLDERFQGGGGALDHALAGGKLDAAGWLIRQGCDVRDAIRNGAAQAPASLIADLLARGSLPTADAAAAAARAGQMESAQLIADALAEVDLIAIRGLIDDLSHWAGRAEASAERIDAGSLMSNRAAPEYRNEGGRMRALRNHCQSLLTDRPRPDPKSLWERLFSRD